jgi:hypothetical protein
VLPRLTDLLDALWPSSSGSRASPLLAGGDGLDVEIALDLADARAATVTTAG